MCLILGSVNTGIQLYCPALMIVGRASTSRQSWTDEDRGNGSDLLSTMLSVELR
jgi:hypothetical protein